MTSRRSVIIDFFAGFFQRILGANERIRVGVIWRR